MRAWTTAVMNAIDEGLLSHQAVAEMCLEWLSEADVEEMCRSNDLVEALRMGEPDEEDELEDYSSADCPDDCSQCEYDGRCSVSVEE